MREPPRQPSIYDNLDHGLTLYDVLHALVNKGGFNEVDNAIFHQAIDRARQLAVLGSTAERLKEELPSV